MSTQRVRVVIPLLSGRAAILEWLNTRTLNIFFRTGTAAVERSPFLDPQEQWAIMVVIVYYAQHAYTSSGQSKYSIVDMVPPHAPTNSCWVHA